MSKEMDEVQAIVEVIELYVAGARSKVSATMRHAFSDDATIFGYAGQDLFSGSMTQLYTWHEGNGPAESLRSQITSIDVIETVAIVRVELDDWTGLRFTDLLSMLKVAGQWRIVNKVFHLHA